MTRPISRGQRLKRDTLFFSSLAKTSVKLLRCCLRRGPMMERENIRVPCRFGRVHLESTKIMRSDRRCTNRNHVHGTEHCSGPNHSLGPGDKRRGRTGNRRSYIPRVIRTVCPCRRHVSTSSL